MDALNGESGAGKCTVPISPTSVASARILASQNRGTYASDGFKYVIVDGNQSTQTGHVDATLLALAFYMDPRNFIGEERTVFQFEELGYDASVHTLASIEKIVSNSFLNNVEPKSKKRYAQLILEAGQQYKVNPCYLAAKIIQEVGNSGSGSVSGTYAGYVGYYNFYNIGAYADANGGAVANALKYASASGTYGRPWNTPEKAIKGGAEFISSSYISKGQSTSYLQKFNVNPNSSYALYTHQYMSAIYDPAQSAASTYNGYVNTGTLSYQRVFLIPVFNNMPGASLSAATSKITINDAGRTGTVNNGGVNIRSGPGINNSTTGYQLSKGQQVTILGGYRTTDLIPIYQHQVYYPYWYHVQFTASNGTTQTGYVFEDYIDTNAKISLTVQGTKTLGYTLTPSNSAEKPMFTSMDSRIASVDQNGKVTGIAAGTTRIIAFVSSGAFDVINVTVGSSSTGKLASTKYTVSGGFIDKVVQKTTLASFKANMTNGSSIKVYNSSGSEVTNTSSYVVTGMTAKLMNGNTVLDSAVIVVKGDTNGDGIINATDFLQQKAHILGSRKLSGAPYKAGDYNNSGVLDATDFLQIKKIILNG
jgi:beta-N-acetylglucosaminidase